MPASPKQGLPTEEELIRRIYAQRERWLDLGDGKEVCVRRPDEWDSVLFARSRSVDAICRYVTNWRGFTEADILGEGVGTVDEVPFGAALFRVMAGDRMDWLEKLLEMISGLIEEHEQAKADSAKN